MREAFERWAVVEGLPVNKGSKKEYLNVKTRLAWRAWKAGVRTATNTRRDMGKWIKCSERMPKYGEYVIVYVRAGYSYIARYNGDFVCDEYVKCAGVTHWMPLPEPPSLV